MPQDITIEVSANSVKDGDRITVNGHSLAVEGTESKTKWTVITFVTGRTMRVENTDQVQVTRSVPTDDERLAQEHERWQHRCSMYFEQLEHEMERAHSGVTEAQAKLEAGSDWRLDGQHGTLSSYLTACARRDIWALVQRIRENIDSHSLFEAIELAAQEFERDLMSNNWRHNSTSALSNTIGEYQREAICYWLRYTAQGVRHLVEDGRQFETGS